MYSNSSRILLNWPIIYLFWHNILEIDNNYENESLDLYVYYNNELWEKTSID